MNVEQLINQLGSQVRELGDLLKRIKDTQQKLEVGISTGLAGSADELPLLLLDHRPISILVERLSLRGETSLQRSVMRTFANLNINKISDLRYVSEHGLRLMFSKEYSYADPVLRVLRVLKDLGYELEKESILRKMSFEGVSLEDPHYGMFVSELPITKRCFNCLYSCGLITLRDLCTSTQEEILKVRNLGKGSLRVILDALSSIGVLIPAKKPIS